jgi:hypothetical protein
MKTFHQFMEQTAAMQQSQMKIAKVKTKALETRQHNRFANLQRLHTTMHLKQTADQEKKRLGL